MRVNSSERLHLKTSIEWRIDDVTNKGAGKESESSIVRSLAAQNGEVSTSP